MCHNSNAHHYITYQIMKKFALTALALIAGLTASAQLLWKVSGNGSKGESFIFATHHVAPTSVLDSIAGLNDAIKSVETVYGEIDMAEMTSPSAQQVIMTFAMAPSDSTLTQVLTPSQIDSINTVLAKYTQGMVKVEQMNVLKPAMVNTQIAMFQAMVEFPEFNGKEQLDMTVQNRGKEAGKAVKGFETMDEQLGMLMCDPIMEQVDDLMHTVRTDGTASEQAHQLANAYRTGNLEEIEKIMFAPEVGMSEDTAERLLFRRNDNWIAKLKGILPSETVFIAVGAGHLIGEHGLLEQLKKLGYTVEPVK